MNTLSNALVVVVAAAIVGGGGVARGEIIDNERFILRFFKKDGFGRWEIGSNRTQ